MIQKGKCYEHVDNADKSLNITEKQWLHLEFKQATNIRNINRTQIKPGTLLTSKFSQQL